MRLKHPYRISVAKAVFCLSIALLSLLFISCESAQRHLAMGKKYEDEGYYREACGEYKLILEKYPDSPIVPEVKKRLVYVEEKLARLFPVIQNRKWGYMDVDGKVAIISQFDEASLFSEGLACVKVAGRWGYIDKLGKYIINPVFDEAFDFSEGLACVLMNGKFGYIDRKGEFVVPPLFGGALEFSEGLAFASFEGFLGRWGYIDSKGDMVVKPQFSFIGGGDYVFSEGLACVSFGNLLDDIIVYGYIDHSGSIVINPLFIAARRFSEGLAFVYGKDDEGNPMCGYINKAGEFVIRNDKSCFPSNFSEGLAKFLDERKYGYIDKVGEIVIKPQFGAASDFSDGLANIKIGDKWGYIDKAGKMVIEPQFDSLALDDYGSMKLHVNSNFSNGLALVGVGDKFGYIDRTGKYIWNPTK